MSSFTIGGFTIVRNGVELDYPFIESISSALLLVDEFVVVVGNSEDSTVDRIRELASDKVRIIETDWDPALRAGGKILAKQTDIGLAALNTDWGLYLQADEILHEKDLDGIRSAADRFGADGRVDGLLFDYYHFWGYHHICQSRRAYRREIRMVKTGRSIFSYRDAQGFRKHVANSISGAKLSVIHLKGPHIYAYSRVRSAKAELEKVKHIARYWHSDDYIDSKYGNVDEWDYQSIDSLSEFERHKHPSVMHLRVEKADRLEFTGTPIYRSSKDRIAQLVERFTGWRIGEYRNYRIVGKYTVPLLMMLVLFIII